MKSLLISLFVLIIFSFPVKSQNVGDNAPDFSLTDLNGNTVTLNQYKGKVVALFIFGYACSSCIAVAPDVKSKVQDVFGPNSNFILLGLDQWDGNKAAVESFRSKTGATYPLLQKASSTASLYNSTWDRIIVVDQQGKIAFKGTKLVSTDLNAAISIISSLLVVTDIAEIQKEFNAEIYPNPVASMLNIKLSNINNDRVTITLKNIIGNEVQTLYDTKSSVGQDLYSINLDGVSPGIYFVDIAIGKKTQVFKIVKQ